MERRAFLAIGLSLAVLLVYQLLMPKRVPPAPVQTPSVSQAVPPAPAAPSSLVPAAAPPATTAPVAASAAAPADAASAESEVRVETANVIAVFTNRGARLKSWKLKKYKEGSGEPLELVANDLASTQPLPFTLRAADDQTSAILNSSLYSVRGAPEGDAPLTAPASITFDFRSGDLASTKTFVVNPESYTLTFTAQVTRGGVGQSVAIVWGPGLGDRDGLTGSYAVKPEALYSVDGKVSRVSASNLAKQPFYQQPFEYVGIDDHYFASFVLGPGSASVGYAPLSLPAADGKTTRELISYTITPPQADQTLTFYVGPKDFDELASIDRNLTKAINFGMFSVLVVPLLRSLQWIHGYVGNYGWAIVILTIFINLVLFPLNHKSVVSMRKMQEIQPQAKAIQDRYSKLKATDPARQKMNQELMALYKEKGVNPASGCVPMLLTLPVFLAFYAMLQTAIELRGAPFVGWIHDLSMPDPWYVLPVLVGLSQLITQWMTPQAGMDPAQQRIMLIMPAVLIFVFFSTPAGALIYWFVGSVWRIGQMQLTNYMIGPPNVRVTKPAGGRTRHVGQGKTSAAARED